MNGFIEDGQAPFTGNHSELTERVIGVFFRVANELGFGFNEAVYRRAMCVALRRSGLIVEEELAVPVWFWGENVGTFYADIVVGGVLVLELKISEQITKAYEAQLLHYLRASTMEVGLVMTFGEVPKFRRIVMANGRKRSMVDRSVVPTQ